MPEYSCSLPSGTTLYKVWKSNTNAFAVGIRCTNCSLTGRSNSHNLPGPMCPKCKQDTLTKFNLPAQWFIGMYVPDSQPGMIGIRWFDVITLEGPRPPNYSPPDWSNYDRWKRDREQEKLVQRREDRQSS